MFARTKINELPKMQPYGWRVVSINTISSFSTFIREELWLFHWRHYFFLLHVDNADRKGPQYEKAALEASASKTKVTFCLSGTNVKFVSVIQSHEHQLICNSILTQYSNNSIGSLSICISWGLEIRPVSSATFHRSNFIKTSKSVRFTWWI